MNTESQTRTIPDNYAFNEAELNLYKFTALQNAGYVIFLLLYDNYLKICDPKGGVLIETGLLFSAVLIGNIWSVYAGFESDSGGHARSIRKSFDFGVLHGLLLAILPWMGATVPSMWLYAIVFIATLCQAISSAYVNASYHAWFVAAAHNLGYRGSLDPYTSRRRLSANLVWFAVGVLLLGHLPFGNWTGHLALSIAGLAIAAFYFVGAFKSRRMIWTNDLGSFESNADGSETSAAKNCLESFKNARTIMMGDRAVLGASTLFVITWTLGVMVLYFWQTALQNPATSSMLVFWAGIIWIVMTVGRVIGNSLAVLPGDKNSHQAKAKRLALGAWLAGGSMILFAVWMVLLNRSGGTISSILAVLIAVLLITINRIGQEIVLPFAYARIHESKHPSITQNRAAVESLLAVWTTPPLIFTWIMVWVIESWGRPPATLIALVYGLLGALVVLSSLLNKPLVRAVKSQEHNIFGTKT